MRVVVLLVLVGGLVRCAPADEKPPAGPADAFDRMVAVLKYGQLNSFSKPAKEDAAVALGLLGDERAVPVLVEHLASEEDDHLRFEIAKALGWLRSPKAVAGLEKALKDPDEHVRDAAATALKEIAKKDKPVNPAPARQPPANVGREAAPGGPPLEPGKTYRLTLARAGGGELVGKAPAAPAGGWVRVEVRRGDKRVASWVNLGAVEVVTSEPEGEK